jgi:hypothetical protein
MKRFRRRSLLTPFQPAGRLMSRRSLAAGAGALALAGACDARSEPWQTAPAGGRSSRLWPASGPPVLRGAVIAQRRRRLSVDGATFAGGQAALPAYGAAEFEALAAAGANLVVMSFPELWSVGPPWRRDEAMADILLRQMGQARAAGLFVVVGLRSGPGRSDFIFHRESAGDWFPRELIVDSIWRDEAAQAAWSEMCVDAASLMSGRADAAGLILMVEPDVNLAGVDHDGRRLDVWEPAAYARRVGRLSDWRALSGAWAKAVRAANANLPLLISPPAFARPDFLEVMGEPPVAGCVWCVHDYEPRGFTHAPRGRPARLREPTGAFAQRMRAAQNHGGAPVFLGEFGAARWTADAPAYHAARAAACERLGINWAAFRWPTFDAAYEANDDTFSLRAPTGEAGGGAASAERLREAWARNALRP